MNTYFAHAGESHGSEAEATAHEAQTQTRQPSDSSGVVNPVFIIAALSVLVIGAAVAAFFALSKRRKS